MNVRHMFNLLGLLVTAASCVGLATAQQVTGVLGSPSATATITGAQLPPPDPKFGGVITTPITFPEDETFDIGQDTRTPLALVEYRYVSPFKFTGKINKVTFNLGEEKLTAEEEQIVHKALARARDEL